MWRPGWSSLAHRPRDLKIRSAEREGTRREAEMRDQAATERKGGSSYLASWPLSSCSLGSREACFTSTMGSMLLIVNKLQWPPPPMICTSWRSRFCIIHIPLLCGWALNSKQWNLATEMSFPDYNMLYCQQTGSRDSLAVFQEASGHVGRPM